MLTLVEKILFIAAAALSAGLTLHSAERIRRVIRRGSGRFSLRGVVGRLIPTFVNTIFQRITFKTRLAPGVAALIWVHPVMGVILLLFGVFCVPMALLTVRGGAVVREDLAVHEQVAERLV